MSAKLQSSVASAVDSWAGCVSNLGLASVIQLVEDQARSLACEMTGGEVSSLAPAIHQGLPIWVPSNAGAEVSVNAPGEGGDSAVSVPALLAGLAITAHAAEYLYFGSDKRFPVAQYIRRYKLLIQAEASRSANSFLSVEDVSNFEFVLGVGY
ncbi:MAG: hypothetical protein H5U32_03050 [Pseudomonas balearica]|uniref:hypothetical protein n=1 Tax=Stutzerimonas balearica TaxID=74829 RepID=UPI0019A3C978|nr:hypothetical protein [Stutzerimonas balearica]MBC7198206.1 hypothetical protein [Stutzerimonas balearica]